MTAWSKQQALKAVEDFDDYARMGVPGGVNAQGAYMVLTEYIEHATPPDKIVPLHRDQLQELAREAIQEMYAFGIIFCAIIYVRKK